MTNVIVDSGKVIIKMANNNNIEAFVNNGTYAFEKSDDGSFLLRLTRSYDIKRCSFPQTTFKVQRVEAIYDPCYENSIEENGIICDFIVGRITTYTDQYGNIKAVLFRPPTDWEIFRNNPEGKKLICKNNEGSVVMVHNAFVNELSGYTFVEWSWKYDPERIEKDFVCFCAAGSDNFSADGHIVHLNDGEMRS